MRCGDAVFRTLFGAVAFILLATVGVVAAEPPIPPAPTHWATDTAGFLSATTVRALDARLQAYEANTHHQVLVYVSPTTGETPLEEWTVRAFEAWRVGRKGLDDGLVLFVFSRDRTVRIEVGYGMEELVPDATASRIIRGAITPWFIAGDPDRGVTEGVSLILRHSGGESGKGSSVVPIGNAIPLKNADLTIPQTIALFFLLLMVLFMIVRHPWIALYMLVSIIGGGRGGGGYSGGGGFSGGGGRSGGGGASGSW